MSCNNPTLGCLRRHFLQVTSCRTHILVLDDAGCLALLPSALLLKLGHETLLGPSELGQT